MYALPQTGREPQERAETFRYHYHNNTQWIAQVQYTCWEFFEYQGLKSQGRSPASLYLRRHFQTCACYFIITHLAQLFCRGGFCGCSLGNGCSCAPGCCCSSGVSWQISGSNMRDSSRSCRAAALGLAGGVLLESLTGVATLAVFEGLGRQCSMLYKKFLMLKALSTLFVM